MRGRRYKSKIASMPKDRIVNVGASSGRDAATSITLSAAHKRLLNAVAYARSLATGKKVGISEIYAELVEGNIESLTKEAGPYLVEPPKKR